MIDLTLHQASPPAMTAFTALTVADHIRGLARQHGVAPEHTPLDAFAADVSRLSDAEVPGDEIADLVVALKRAGVLDSRQATSLYGNYLAYTRE